MYNGVIRNGDMLTYSDAERRSEVECLCKPDAPARFYLHKYFRILQNFLQRLHSLGCKACLI